MAQAEGSGKGGRANAGGAGDEAASGVQSASERIEVVGIHIGSSKVASECQCASWSQRVRSSRQLAPALGMHIICWLFPCLGQERQAPVFN